jgi:hypothetical protein
VNTGLTERLRQFYAENPDEELTLQDIMVKFGCAYDTAKRMVSCLKRDGVLRAHHVYRVAEAA